jgi:hypothetical protein
MHFIFFHLIRPVALGIPNADLSCLCEILYFTMPSTGPGHRSIQFSIYYFLRVMLIYYLNHFIIILVDNSYTLLCLALAMDIGQSSFQFTTFTSYVDLLLKPFSYNFG